MNPKQKMQLFWLLVLVGPSIFFIRAIMLWAAGGDCLIFLAPTTGWFVLGVELFTGAFTTGGSIYCICRKVPFIKDATNAQIILGLMILITATISFTLHFIRFAIYLELCV